MSLGGSPGGTSTVQQVQATPKIPKALQPMVNTMNAITGALLSNPSSVNIGNALPMQFPGIQDLFSSLPFKLGMGQTGGAPTAGSLLSGA